MGVVAKPRATWKGVDTHDHQLNQLPVTNYHIVGVVDGTGPPLVHLIAALNVAAIQQQKNSTEEE